MKTLVLGASHKPERYSNMAMNMLREYNHEVEALGRRATTFDDWKIDAGKPAYTDVHTVTLYLSAANQREYYDYIKSLKPNRVIFNPGAENEELAKALQEEGVETLNACTLVMLRTRQF